MSTRCPKCIAERALNDVERYRRLPRIERYPQMVGHLRGMLRVIKDVRLRLCKAHEASAAAARAAS